MGYYQVIKFYFSCFMVVLSGLSFASIDAKDSNKKGFEIVKTQKESDAGWNDMVAKMKLILTEPGGDKNVREMRSLSLEVKGDGDKSLSVFDYPNDVKGTAFLTFSHVKEHDDQWLYLPALKRVKRINSRNKTGSFMGSEFTYEDMASDELEKYDYAWIKDEVIQGVDCYVVENYPRDEMSGYTKRVVWIDKQDFKTHKVEFYDKKNAKIKTLSFSDFELFLDKHWRAKTHHMINHNNKRGTIIKWEEITFKTGLADKDFSKNSLKRFR